MVSLVSRSVSHSKGHIFIAFFCTHGRACSVFWIISPPYTPVDLYEAWPPRRDVVSSVAHRWPVFSISLIYKGMQIIISIHRRLSLQSVQFFLSLYMRIKKSLRSTIKGWKSDCYIMLSERYVYVLRTIPNFYCYI